ncbi:YidC/Oxa1 family membrane protein insertase [Candidatus Roizmanbacteria bacterium]|nr:YidC/Oxa1 family membrane protein insertase [Candidatus Roizmanbacteria bacterium]
MLSPNIFNTIFVFPILNILVFFYKLFLFIKLPGAFGFAIIALTVLIRLLLHPFFKQQLVTSKKMQDLKPHIDRLSHKHKDDKKRLQEEQMKLYQQAGINPASGCLFMIIQIPVFIALYNTLSLFLMNGNAGKIISQINKALYSPSLRISTIDSWFFGINLAVTPAKGGQWYYYLVPLITALLQYLQTTAMTPASAPSPVVDDKKGGPSSAEATKGKDDFQKAMSTQMKFIFPLMIGWFSYTLPLGLSLYWNIFSLFSIMQYRNLQKK